MVLLVPSPILPLIRWPTYPNLDSQLFTSIEVCPPVSIARILSEAPSPPGIVGLFEVVDPIPNSEPLLFPNAYILLAFVSTLIAA